MTQQGKAVQQLIKEWEKEKALLLEIQKREKKNSFFWSISEGALGECYKILDDLEDLQRGGVCQHLNKKQQL